MNEDNQEIEPTKPQMDWLQAEETGIWMPWIPSAQEEQKKRNLGEKASFGPQELQVLKCSIMGTEVRLHYKVQVTETMSV